MPDWVREVVLVKGQWDHFTRENDNSFLARSHAVGDHINDPIDAMS